VLYEAIWLRCRYVNCECRPSERPSPGDEPQSELGGDDIGENSRHRLGYQPEGAVVICIYCHISFLPWSRMWSTRRRDFEARSRHGKKGS
jgi:hypothetical protein